MLLASSLWIKFLCQVCATGYITQQGAARARNKGNCSPLSLSLCTQKKEDAVPLYVNAEVDDARIHLRLYKAVATFLSHWSVVSTKIDETFETLSSSESPPPVLVCSPSKFSFVSLQNPGEPRWTSSRRINRSPTVCWNQHFHEKRWAGFRLVHNFGNYCYCSLFVVLQNLQ